MFSDAFESEDNESFADVERLLYELKPLPSQFNVEQLWRRIAHSVGLSPQQRGRHSCPQASSVDDGDKFQ